MQRFVDASDITKMERKDLESFCRCLLYSIDYNERNLRPARGLSGGQQPYVCPICVGRGNVPRRFYFAVGPISISTSGATRCKSCDGKGVLWSKEADA